ncbi:MAG TPA: RNA-binding protein [Sporomusaceae bacterium]|nr:RNA-binding protein [Sporomusaceae bacterium]
MCEVNAYRYENGKVEFILESVDKVVFTDTGLDLKNSFGQRKTIDGKIMEFAMVGHRMIFYMLKRLDEK